MSTIENAEVALTPAAGSTSSEIKTVNPKTVIANIDPHTYEFKHFTKPRKPKGIVTCGDTYEYQKDEKGNFIWRTVTLENGKTKREKVPVLDADGNKIVKRKRAGNRVSAIEIQRCAKAVTTREAAIATAE